MTQYLLSIYQPDGVTPPPEAALSVDSLAELVERIEECWAR